MLLVISSKNDSEIYTLATKEKNKALDSTGFLDIEIDISSTLSENVSIFGDKNAYMIRVTREDQLENIDETLLKSLTQSPHFFVVVGSGVDFEKKFSANGTKVTKIEERKVFDFPTELVSALQKHDKKNAWNLLYKELQNKDAEPVHGSCSYAYKTLLVYLNDPKKNSELSGIKDFPWNNAKRNAVAGKREKGEVVDKYFNLIFAYHKARMGEGDLAKNLEKWVLEN